MRTAVDTSVLVRLLVDDGSPEVAKVARFARSNHIVIAPTVLLETEWVLRYSVGLGRGQIAAAFDNLLGLTSASVLERDAVVRAVDVFREGCDFADALHWAGAATVDAFVTLDRKFSRRAGKLGLVPEVRSLAHA